MPGSIAGRSASWRSVVTGVLIAVAGLPLLAQQDDRSRVEAMEQRASERLQSLQREADQMASEERTLLGDLRKLELEREIKSQELGAISEKTAAAARDLAKVNGELERLEESNRNAGPELAARIVDLYKLGAARYVHLLLSVSDVRQIGQASRMVTALAKRDRDRAEAAGKRREELTATRKALETRQRELSTLRAQAVRAQTDADRAVAARNALITSIDNERDLNAQLAGELLAAEQKLQVTLRSVGAAPGAALPFLPFRGDLEWPVSGTVRQRFSGASSGARGASNGIQIAAAEGTPVRAVHEGTVAFADTFTGFGRLVILEHDAQTFTLYGNLGDVAVSRGARVEAGQEIGSVGVSPTGSAGLYFELRVDGRPVDPLQWLRRK